MIIISSKLHQVCEPSQKEVTFNANLATRFADPELIIR